MWEGGVGGPGCSVRVFVCHRPNRRLGVHDSRPGMLSVAPLHHVDISLKDNEHKPVVAEAVTQHDLIAHHMSDHMSDLVNVHVENNLDVE